jgi:hypothetical protein
MANAEFSLRSRHEDLAMARQIKTLVGYVVRAGLYVLVLPLIVIAVLSPWAAAAWGISRLFSGT